jgi:hypothetical protein
MMLSMLSAAAMFGCSSSTKEGGKNGGAVATVGDTACFQCHSATIDPLTKETFVAQYQRSLHAELGCESCHGGGSQHNGIGPFPFELNSKTTDAQKAQRCAMCHNGTDAPLSSSINFQNGNHANPFSAEEAHEAKCARCHSHEGSILYGIEGYTGDQSILNNAAYQPVLPRDPETFNTIKCATCHEHGGNLRQFKTRNLAGDIVAWDPNGNKVNDQIDLCTSCHTMTTNEGKLIGSGNDLTVGSATVPTAPYYHNTRWFRTLPSTHYDQPATAAGTIIEGYNLRKVSQTKTPCFDCHGHEFKANTRALVDHPERPTTIFTDWAQSGHAGKLLNQKLAAAAGKSGTAQVDAVMTAGATETSGAAWVHYDWDHTMNANDAADRGPCQACHTSTGIANYLTDAAGYDYKNNDFTHLSGWKKATATAATVPSGQNEMLYCWGCHSNAGAGQLRNTTAATLTFKYDDQPIVITGLGNSTACVVCHGGRGSATEAAGSDATKSTRFNGHHAPTAGIMFNQQTHIGYEYAGLDYTNKSYYAHDKIGQNAAGPCASCHMAGKNHTFSAVDEAAGTITNQALCNTCHTPGGQYEMTFAKLEEEKGDYKEASDLLNNYVNQTNGFVNYLGVAITAANYKTVPEGAYGAFQNGKLNGEEPCAYVHNRIYAKRLIFDAIDWMDNGAINGTITIDATTYPKAAAWFGAPAGTTGNFTASRP